MNGKLRHPMVLLWSVAAWTLLALNIGCQPSESTPPASDGNATAQSSTAPGTATGRTRPEEAVTAFLEALKMGDDTLATSLLTAQAQQEMERANAAIKPPGSPTAETKHRQCQQQKSVRIHGLSSLHLTLPVGRSIFPRPRLGISPPASCGASCCSTRLP